MSSRHPENMPPLITDMGFPGGPVVKNLPANTGDSVSIPESQRSSGGGNSNPLQYSRLENPHGQKSLAGFSPVESDRLK